MRTSWNDLIWGDLDLETQTQTLSDVAARPYARVTLVDGKWRWSILQCDPYPALSGLESSRDEARAAVDTLLYRS